MNGVVLDEHISHYNDYMENFLWLVGDGVIMLSIIMLQHTELMLNRGHWFEKKTFVKYLVKIS